jgi:hypothetical protein
MYMYILVHGRCWGATLTLVAAEKTVCDFDFTSNRHVHVQLLLTSVYMYVYLNGKHIKFHVHAYQYRLISCHETLGTWSVSRW